MPLPEQDPALFRQRLEEQAREIGFDAVGIAPPAIADRDRQRLAELVAGEEYGSMTWMASRVEQRGDPRTLWPDVRSVITLGINYGPERDPLALLDEPDRGAISVYAHHKDYHDLVKKRLKRLGRWLIEQAGGDIKVFVDTAPVPEKALAALSGLGWQGKHSNLVSRNFGSWLFLGEIYTTLELAPDPVEKDHCGRCSRCIDACPTGAITAPYRLEPRRCISYLTIEHDGPIPEDMAAAMGNRIYGCDDCLAVCPWNRFAQISKEAAFQPREELVGPALRSFLSMDEAAFRAFFAGSPVKRSGRRRILRNVLIALANAGDREALPEIRALLNDDEPLIRDAAARALRTLGPT